MIRYARQTFSTVNWGQSRLIPETILIPEISEKEGLNKEQSGNLFIPVSLSLHGNILAT